MNTVVLEEGKYTIKQYGGYLQALRYGEPWRDLTGDKLIGAMVSKIKELETNELKLHKQIADLQLHAEQGWSRYENANNLSLSLQRQSEENTSKETPYKSALAECLPHFEGHYKRLLYNWECADSTHEDARIQLRKAEKYRNLLKD